MLVRFAPTSDVEHCLCTRDLSPANMYEAYYLKMTQTFNTNLRTTRYVKNEKKSSTFGSEQKQF